MFLSSMRCEFFSFFLHHVSWHVTNVAFICLIVIKSLIFLSESGKSIEHDTLDYISKEHAKKCTVYHIISESTNFKCFHSLRNGSRDIQGHDTIKNIITHLIDFFSFWVNILHVVAESNCTKDKDKNNAHKANIE